MALTCDVGSLRVLLRFLRRFAAVRTVDVYMHAILVAIPKGLPKKKGAEKIRNSHSLVNMALQQ